MPLLRKIFDPARDALRKVLKSDIAAIFIFAATGAGGWEAALSNTGSSGDKILAARNGMFSHRWIDMCRRHSLDVYIVETL